MHNIYNIYGIFEANCRKFHIPRTRTLCTAFSANACACPNVEGNILKETLIKIRTILYAIHIKYQFLVIFFIDMNNLND